MSTEENAISVPYMKNQISMFNKTDYQDRERKFYPVPYRL
jgi:hypothetical protein